MADQSQMRPRLSNAAAEVFTTDFFRDACMRITEIMKGTYEELEADCPGCGYHVRKKILVKTNDIPKQIAALTDLMNQIEGRPGAAEVADAGLTLVVERNWPRSVDHGEQ